MAIHNTQIQQEIDDLIQKTINRGRGGQKDSFINLNPDNSYAGWVKDLGVKKRGKTNNYSLDLTKEWDLFLLFVMAVAWSRTGPFENAVAIVACFIKENINNKKIDSNLVVEARKIRDNFKGIVKDIVFTNEPREKLSFREDVPDSIAVLVESWTEIKQKLQDVANTGKWEDFIRYLNSISGLGSGENRMNIKILLILRELKCQGIYKNISGELCCVPDKRVKDAYYALYKKNLKTNMISASKKIYDDFGDLYDIPLFAVQDLIIDAHSHKNDSHKYLKNCVGTICCCSKYEDLDRLCKIRDGHTYKCFGIHPWYIDSIKPDYKDKLCNLLNENEKATKKYHIGEIGLDKYTPDMDRQIEIFKSQLEIAIEFKRTVFIHCVGAWDKMLEILKTTKGVSSIKIVMHAFNGNAEITKHLLKYNNVYFSFNKCMSVIKDIPGNRILVETDWDKNKDIDYNYLTDLISEISKIKPNILNQIYDNTKKVL